VRRTGICGGTFDPFHRGHLEPVLAAAATVGWDQVVYVPAFRQPFKEGEAISSPFHRFAMAALGVAESPNLALDPIELERGTISYTVDTLEELARERSGEGLDWIIGDDNLRMLGSWRSIDRILELANFVVLARGGSSDDLPEHFRPRVTPAAGRPRAGAIVFAENPSVEISATEIRRLARTGESIAHLVPPGVADYIERNRLYTSEEAN
jgi:nicotinate-nucleotide adenylyltransferase